MDPDLSNVPQNKFPVRVQVVGATGEQITEFGGSSGSIPNPLPVTSSSLTTIANLSKAEDSAHASGDTGMPTWGVANEAQSTFVADGDYVPQARDTKGNTFVTGNVASGTTDSGRGVKVSGVYKSTRDTFTDGQRADVQVDTRGNTATTLFAPNSVNSIAVVASSTDGQTTTATSSRLEVMSRNTAFNETGFDRRRNNTEGTVLTSAARTATTNGADQVNYNGQGVVLIINVTAEAAAETLSLKIQGKDPISGNYYDITDFGVVYNAATDAPTTTRTFVARPGVTAADFIGITGNGTSGKSVAIPRTWRPVVTHSASGSFTYSLASAVIL